MNNNNSEFLICLYFIKDQEYLFSINYSKGNSSISCSKELSDLLKDHEELIKSRLEHSENLYEFMVEFKHILNQTIRAQNNLKKSLSNASVYSRLFYEIENIGWDSLIFISQDLHKIQFKIQDSDKVNHIVEILLDSDYPLVAPKCSIVTPVPLELQWNPNHSTLNDVIAQCKKHLLKFQDFWKICDDIDSHTCVLEPERPTKAHVIRRISISKHVSLHLEINPFSPRSVPECRFLGSDSAISTVKSKLNKNLHLWDSNKTIRENLEFIMELKLPTPKDTKDEELNLACAICYSYRLVNEIPDKICDNPNCRKSYHASCLYQWLSSIRSNRHSFDTIFGQCPYCQEQISVKNPSVNM